MRIVVHIGLDHMGADRIQATLAAKRDQLQSKGVMYPRSPGNKNHTRLFMAVTDPDHVDPLRFQRGYATADAQGILFSNLNKALQDEVAAAKPDTVILSASQLGASLSRVSELERLKALLSPLRGDIEVVAHVDNQARVLTRHYAHQVMEGRLRDLGTELDLAKGEDWWNGALALAAPPDPVKARFLEIQTPPFWLDYAALVQHWESVFGTGRVTLRGYDPKTLYSADITSEIRAAFGLKAQIGKGRAVSPPDAPSAATLARGRAFNALLIRLAEKENRAIPRQLWRRLIDDMARPGAPIPAGSLSAISDHFAADNAALKKAHPAIGKALNRDKTTDPWTEADPEQGFRASQYMLAHLHRIENDSRSPEPPKAVQKKKPPAPTHLPPAAAQHLAKLQSSSFLPHNRLGRVNENDLAAPYDPAPPRTLPQGSSGRVIVGCMKNEAPYILEWVAYHRAIGVDSFLIYTNGCDDGTDAILKRLDAMGLLHHRDNDKWKGNSPQQYALNQSLKEPVIRKAEWIIHIDVDEFINVRCDNGTLDDFLARVPDATNVAMTWRLFGHGGVTRLEDRFVIDQFDLCAPKYCPKPHTVWGFKTMLKNIGAYEKLSCHRPNKLKAGMADKVRWVNGSGQPMGDEVKENGWRSSKRSIGYDLLQLNHYALRSADSFLIKRQRGRALHVDRSIGLNYWIRMDWGHVRDLTIKRNIPRLRAEYDRLLADPELAALHAQGLAWHRAKADELHGLPEFQELYTKALDLRLTEAERVAYSLAVDVES